ncbi:aminopeptidase [Rhodocytophaga aerolata]|uniref:Aminopeptidase n=1 Tax=Rhodocytophaga aerolata TaxID=455078 RepID=A0ABT8R9X4_9BACT|nr:aminopeptidase [Rhodocytophaga aerolata]MDO1448882.1 aminopeptidase [Rhodocytophaga aerolata]
MVKKVFYSILLGVALLAVWQYQLIWYGLGQAYGQFRIIYNARPLKEYLTDHAFPDSLKQKLLLIQEIRKFAIDSLGINDSKNYTTVFDQKGKPILWVVTASEPYALEAKEWKFPLLGSVSYKGFFDHEKAVKEENQLKAQGYDTEIDEVAGWSTLGWFRDPILSSMLEKKEGQLANLIIHELTHATLYIKSNVDYNENLASFVGDHGAREFLRYKYGEESAEYKTYTNSRNNQAKYIQHILHGADLLDSLYKSFTPKMDKVTKDNLKNGLIQKIMDTTDTLTYSGTTKKALVTRNNTKEEPLPNNAFFMSYIRYRSKQNQFEEEFATKFNSNFKKYLTYLKKTYPSI